jgi:hypothetical protein
VTDVASLSPKSRPAQRAPQVGFEVDDQLIFGRFPNRAPRRHDPALIEAFKGGGVDMPDRGSYCGTAQTVHYAQRGRAKAFRPPDGVDEP